MRAQSTDQPSLVAARQVIWAQVQSWLAEGPDGPACAPRDGESGRRALLVGVAVLAVALAGALVVLVFMWRRRAAGGDRHALLSTASE